jgi:anti-sigma B factor antagonist
VRGTQWATRTSTSSSARAVSATWRAIARRDDGTGVVYLVGELDLSVVEQLEEELRGALAQSKRALKIDLTDVTYIDSSSVGVLMRTLSAATDAGKTMRVVNACGICRRVLEVAGVAEVLGLDGVE